MTAALATDELFHLLDVAAEWITDNIEEPNAGGCAVIAAAVGAELERLGVPVEVVTPDFGGAFPAPRPLFTEAEPVTNAVADARNVARHHFAVRFKVDDELYTWDSDGFGDSWHEFPGGSLHCYYPFGEGFTVEQARQLADDEYGWNSLFDRRQIPELREAVADIFKRSGFTWQP